MLAKALAALIFGAFVSLAVAKDATPAAAISAITRQSFVVQSPNVKIADIKTIPFIAGDTPVFDITDVHVKATRQARGVFVELRFTGSPYRRHFTSDGTPFVLKGKAGAETLFALDGVDWTVTCFRSDVFAAKILVPAEVFERLDGIEVAPMRASSRHC